MLFPSINSLIVSVTIWSFLVTQGAALPSLSEVVSKAQRFQPPVKTTSYVSQMLNDFSPDLSRTLSMDTPAARASALWTVVNRFSAEHADLVKTSSMAQADSLFDNAVGRWTFMTDPEKVSIISDLIKRTQAVDGFRTRLTFYTHIKDLWNSIYFRNAENLNELITRDFERGDGQVFKQLDLDSQRAILRVREAILFQRNSGRGEYLKTSNSAMDGDKEFDRWSPSRKVAKQLSEDLERMKTQVWLNSLKTVKQ